MTLHSLSPPCPSGPAVVLSATNCAASNLSAAIGILQHSTEAFRVEYLRAVLADQIAVAHVFPNQPFPFSRLERTGRPALLILLDDDDTTRLGPDGWPGAERVMRWASAGIIHGTGGRPAHYRLAVASAQRSWRVFILETTSALIRPWSELALRHIEPTRLMRIQPPPGGHHPVAPRAEVLQ